MCSVYLCGMLCQAFPPREMVRYLLLNCFARVRGNMRSTLILLAHGGGGTLIAWQGVSAVTPDQAFKKKNVLAIAHQEQGSARRGGSEEEATKRRELTAPRFPFYKPWAKGGVMTQSNTL